MLEKIRDFVIFFFVSDSIFAVFIFLLRFDFIHPTTEKFRKVLYIFFTILLFFSSIYIIFFSDPDSGLYDKIYNNKNLYEIPVGETISLNKFTGKDVIINIYYMTDFQTGKKKMDVLYIDWNGGKDNHCELKLNRTKRDSFQFDKSMFHEEGQIKHSSKLMIYRKDKHSFSLYYRIDR